jgi:hypothetical protein
MVTKKKRNKHSRKTIKKMPNNKLTVDIDFTSSDGGFNILRSDKVMQYLIKSIKKGRNLIQTVPGKPFYAYKKTKLHLQAIKYDNYSMRPEWKEVLCKSRGKWLKSSPCKIGTRNKVFVKYKGVKNGNSTHFLNKGAGFAAYFSAILEGDIDEKKHMKFVNVLRKTMKKEPIVVHNMDVDWFHLKSDA